MKAVPKVNTNGLYLEDTIVDDAFTGVVPFYAPKPEPETVELDGELTEGPEEEEPEREIAGYIVGVPIQSRLYRPRFDIAAWEEYQDAIAAAEDEYQTAYAEWAALPEDARGEDPTREAIVQPELWGEGLTPEEIEELTRPLPQEPTPTDLLGAELTAMKLQNIEQQAMVSALGSELADAKLDSIQQQQTISALGEELAAAKIEIIQLKGGEQS